MNKLIFSLVLLAVFGFSSADEQGDLYAYLKEKVPISANWVIKRTNYGLNISSKETIKNPSGDDITAIRLDMEGPQTIPDGITLDDVLRQNIDGILKTTAINPKFKTEAQTVPGLGASIVNINGQNVGLIEYEILSDQKIFVRHGLILHQGRLYVLTMMFLDPLADRKQAALMEMLIIGAINSKKL